jgi:xanthine dehydrogenase small subunit
MNVIRFCLNGNWIEEASVDPNWTILRYLRTNKAHVAAKEGCAGGDCGACSILMGQQTHTGTFEYQAINGCITLLGSLHGKYVVTVEGLKEAEQMHPVQQAMVDKHGSQCGFCTPGIVSALTALHFNRLHNQQASVTDHDIHIALSGNLCRCTGYRSIMDAAHAMFDYPAPSEHAVINQTSVVQFDPADNKQGAQPYLEKDGRQLYVPQSEQDLQQLLTTYPDAKLWAGGTDLGLEITQQFKQFDRIISLHQVASLKAVTTSQKEIRLGSMVTYSESESVLAKSFPSFVQLIERIGSRQIRNLGTLGGNVANGSPIGDTPPVFFALNAKVVLACAKGEREIAIQDFYHGYKQTDLQAGEYLKAIVLPKLKPQQSLHVYKVSKRKDDDISAVLLAGVVEHDGKVIVDARIACGGMAATPMHAVKTEKALIGQTFNLASFEQASAFISQDYSPIKDVRASKEYRLTVAANLVKKIGLECLGGL